MTPRRLSFLGLSVILAGTFLDAYFLGRVVATLGSVTLGFGIAMRAFLRDWRKGFVVQVFPESQTIVIGAEPRGGPNGE